MRNSLQVLILALSASLFAPAPAPSAAAVTEGSSGPPTWELYVTVEKEGKLIGGLSERNFHVYVDGEPVDFRLEEPEKPMTATVLVEYSRASWPYWNDINAAMRSFLDVAPDGNWYALATFAHELSIDVDFTKQKGQIPSTFSQRNTPMWSEVDTYDAVYQILDIMGRLSGRRVLIFIGSGFDTFSRYTIDEVQEKLESVNATVFALGAGSLLRGRYERYLNSTQRLDLHQAQAFLQMLADKSGGWAVFPRFEAAFGDSMKGVMQSLEFQYKLVYQGPGPAKGEFQDVEVKAFQIIDDKREDFKVRVRDGWRDF